MTEKTLEKHNPTIKPIFNHRSLNMLFGREDAETFFRKKKLSVICL